MMQWNLLQAAFEKEIMITIGIHEEPPGKAPCTRPRVAELAGQARSYPVAGTQKRVGVVFQFTKGNHLDVPAAAQAFGCFVKNVNQGFVGLAAAKVFPPVRHQDRQRVRFHATENGVEDFRTWPVAGKKTARMREEPGFPHAPVISLAQFLDGEPGPP